MAIAKSYDRPVAEIKEAIEWKRGKKSDRRQPSPTLYLDENFDCREVREVLERHGVSIAATAKMCLPVVEHRT